MTDLKQGNVPSDEMLVAYLDGELQGAERAEIEAAIKSDAQTAARFAYLSRSALPFSKAFAPLLQNAPMEKLESMLDRIPASANPDQAPENWNRRGFLAAAIGFIMVGVIADRGMLALQHPKEDEDAEWRAVVAQYVALYTPETLADLTSDARSQSEQLRAISDKLSLPLPAEAVSLPGMQLKRAQLLQYDGRPLGQLAYLDPEHGPAALCIAPSSTGPTDLKAEQRRGMNVVYWSDASHGFMLIGHNPADQIQSFGRKIQASLTA
jgi:anti-sigma factor RsiW